MSGTIELQERETSAGADAGAVLEPLRSLADETRARSLLLLERDELTVGEVSQVLQLPQSTVSRHLAILLNDGWLRVRADGTSRHYRLAPDLPDPLRRLWGAVREGLGATRAAAEDRARAGSVLQARAERARAFFAQEASRWDHLKARLFGQGADLRLLPALLEGTETIGDLGCGTGGLTALLAPFAGRVVGVDRSPEMLELAHRRVAERPNVELRQGTLEELPLADASLDVAVLALVLHYVADPARVLSEVRRTLRPGGRLLLLDMEEHDRSGFHEEMGHLWLGFPEVTLEGWLEEAGFGDVLRTTLPPDPDATGPRLFALRARRVRRRGRGRG